MLRDDEQFRRTLERRSSILSQLVTAPARKPELVDVLDSSRSTIDRAIDELTAIDCVRKDDGEYIATTAGQLALQTHDQYECVTDAIAATTEFANYLPDDAPLSTDLLDGASITMSSDHAPDQALSPSNELFKRATQMRGLAPVVLSFYPSHIADQLATTDLTVEIVASTDVINTLPSLPQLGETSLTDTDGLSLYEAGEELPYALWLMDTPESDYAGITAYDAGGVVGVLINESRAAVEWAEVQYEQYRASATEATLSHT